MGESLHIPTFAAGASGPYLPGCADQGRVAHRNAVRQLARGNAARRAGPSVGRSRAAPAGGDGRKSRRSVLPVPTVCDSSVPAIPIRSTRTNFKVYLLRTSTLQPRGNQYALGWKQSPRGAVDGARPEESTPTFAEMAAPGSVFEGNWAEKNFFLQPEVRRALRWPESFDRSKIFEAANIYAAGLLTAQRNYAATAGLGLLDKSLEELEQRLAQARQNGSCLLALGWGGGLLAKSSWLDTTNPEYRKILEQFTLYNRALSTNLPFPKTRRIVFLNNRPATLPGWAELRVE